MRHVQRPLARAIVALVALACGAVLLSAPSASAGEGGSAGVRGSGDEIISSILAATSGRGPGSAPRTAPRCRWQVLSDEQVLYLMHVRASRPELLTSAFANAVDEYTGSVVVEHVPQAQEPNAEGEPVLPETAESTRLFGSAAVRNFRIQVHVCGGVADTMSVTSEVVNNGVARGIAAVRSIAVLTPPVIEVAPSGMALVGEPVFFNVAPPEFEPRSLALAGSSVSVTARPASLTLFDGQFARDVGRTLQCGFNSGFDAGSGLSPSQQARQPSACVFRYSRITGDPGDAGAVRSDSWNGYGRVQWDVQYTIGDAAGRRQSGTLDDLFSYTLFDVSVREVESVLRG